MTIRFCKNGFQERVYLIFTSNTVGRFLFVEVKMDPGLSKHDSLKPAGTGIKLSACFCVRRQPMAKGL